jgi:hypothetical protein
MQADDIIFNGLNKQGEKVELARVKTNVVDVEFDTDIEVSNGYKPKSMKLSKEQEANAVGIDAVGINISGSAAFKLGLQADISLLGVVNGNEKGAYGVTIGANALAGIEGGVDLFNVSFYFANDISTFKLTDLAGTEMGVQGSFSGLGGSMFRGVEYETQSMFYQDSGGGTKMRSPIKEYVLYTGFSSGASVGILPADGSAYIGYSSFIYTNYKNVKR